MPSYLEEHNPPFLVHSLTLMEMPSLLKYLFPYQLSEADESASFI